MCMQCATESETLFQVVPGYYLCLAKKPYGEWTKWGLVECNDPFYCWESDPVKDYYYDFTDDQLDKEPLQTYDQNSSVFDNNYEEFAKNFKVHPETGYDLVKACTSVGYDGSGLGPWLFHRMGWMLELYNKDRE